MLNYLAVRLNLRNKLIIGFVGFLLISSAINYIFLKDFRAFERNLKMLIYSHKINNICLEIRRHEKNFFIRELPEEFQITTQYITDLLAFIESIENDVDVAYEDVLEQLKIEIGNYQTSFYLLEKECIDKNILTECAGVEEIQHIGAQLVSLSEGMARLSEVKISQFIKATKIQLSLYYAFLVAFSVVGILVYHVTIARRLKSLEQSADAVARGQYENLPVSKTNDEVHAVFKAFQRMLVELEERQEQLFQAEKLSSIGTLASGMAHQLNNPLNNISTSCQLAMEEAKECTDGVENPFLLKMLSNIAEENQRAAEIVRGLLEFSRSELFACKLTSIKELVSQSVELVTSDLPAGVSIIQDIPPDLVICVDKQKVKEVFLNLLINSIQSIKEPTGTITIAAELEIDRQEAVITFSDTGVGISDQDKQKIFDPFFTTKDVGEGTGLGLAVAYGIIKKHKGSISVQNNKEKGTTFIITLPLS